MSGPQGIFEGKSDEEVRRFANAARRMMALREAKTSLLRFIQLNKPDPNDPDNADKSLYEATPQAKLLCDVIEKVQRRDVKRVAISISPQTGKSEVLSRHAPAWLSGHDPTNSHILASYNEKMAEGFGSDVRDIIRGPTFRQMFGEQGYALSTDTSSKSAMKTTKGGRLNFVGTGGSTTGMRADHFTIDDPIKDNEQAQSPTFRDNLWDWFNAVVSTRLRGNSTIVIVHTRWHEDDLIGRLCDPDHPERNKKYKGIADNWVYLNIPAVITDPKLAAALGLELEVQTHPLVLSQFGDKPMASLWEREFPLPFLAEMRQQDPDGRVFNALRMGKPTPDEGVYFRSDDIVEYEREDLPVNLRLYGASDHAVSEKQSADYTVLGCVGVDANDDIWVLPDVVWERMETDRTVEEILSQMQRHQPMIWWMEEELISKSFGPFLRKRMQEERVFTPIEGARPTKDKMTRARSIQGRMQMRKVRFPAFAPWWREARAQILRFPFGANDDFVDFLAHIGMGLHREISASAVSRTDSNVVRVGSIEWIMKGAKKRIEQEARQKANSGW